MEPITEVSGILLPGEPTTAESTDSMESSSLNALAQTDLSTTMVVIPDAVMTP